MSNDRDIGHVVDLQSRASYRPDVGGLARNQLAAARRAAGLDSAAFAEVLTSMVGWPVTPEALEAWENTAVPPGDVLVAVGLLMHSSPAGTPGDVPPNDLLGQLIGDRFADVTAVFPTRSETYSSLPPHALFENANEIRASGLSLNLICQICADHMLRALLESGTQMRCLFLDPRGEAIASREREEGYPPGHLSALTAMNIQILQSRVRDLLSSDAHSRLEIATYDEIVRFNITLIDGETCIVQPYFPQMRGIDAPTFVIRRRPVAGLYPIFSQLFESLWERGTQV
jgi:hypothetical protein